MVVILLNPSFIAESKSLTACFEDLLYLHAFNLNSHELVYVNN